MSAKAPAVPGGTTDNVETRFEVEETDVLDSVTQLESLCMNCHESGRTRLMLTAIPYFQEIILMSFDCDHCGYKNSEVQFGGRVAEKGVHLELNVTSSADLNRQLIKSDTATLSIPALEFEIPAKTQRGTINTIEGFLQKAVSDLRENQDERRKIDPEATAKLDSILADLALMATGISLPFLITLDDPAGNSYIENPLMPNEDPNLSSTVYDRTEAQDIECGLQPHNETDGHEVPETVPRALPPRNEGLDALAAKDDDAYSKSEEAIQFPTNCHACNAPGFTCMCMTDIPHFKEIIIMSFNCEACGFKSNEIKGGGAVPPQGERITLSVDPVVDPDVLDRDVLKADSAHVSIPEIHLEMAPGSLGGIYTTIEGLLGKVKENIEQGNPFALGDSDGGRSKLSAWFAELDELREGKKPFTLIISDPLANSFIYSPHGSSKDDPLMTAELYDRTFEENEDLGLNDIKTENYKTDEASISSSVPNPENENVIKSDKETMAGGGEALSPQKYHPNPDAVMQLDK